LSTSNLVEMTFKNFIGVDVSKRNLDLCLVKEQEKPSFYRCLNTTSAITETLTIICNEHGLDRDCVLLCAEHTSYYTRPLQQVCIEGSYKLWLENAAQIKCSQGVQRGKDDKQDAGRIAIYAQRFADKATILQASKLVYEQLAYLSAERELLLKDASKYRAQLKDEADFIDPAFFKAKKKRTQRLIKELEASLAAIEKQISTLIDSDADCRQQYKLLTSIDGIGKQVAVHTIIETKGFTRFTDPRKFACHAGVAPFKYFSGSSIRSANKVSHRANKKLKTLLHMAALSVLRMKNELRDYFDRKVAEGKNKMSVINAIRAKLIARMFAVVNKNIKYQKRLQSPIA